MEPSDAQPFAVNLGSTKKYRRIRQLEVAAPAGTIEAQREMLKAYENGQLNQVAIRTLKRLIEQRRFRGKKRSQEHRQGTRTTAEGLVNAYRKETERQKSLIRKAKLTEEDEIRMFVPIFFIYGLVSSWALSFVTDDVRRLAGKVSRLGLGIASYYGLTTFGKRAFTCRISD